MRLMYGKGLADIDLNELLEIHRDHGKRITGSAVRPAARFGELEIADGRVASLKEKPQLHGGWINGGFFVVEPRFFDLIEGDATMLEREPLEAATNAGELMAYQHNGFWHCMDTKRDHERSEEHTSELQSLMRISYAVFCLKKKNKKNIDAHTTY